MAGRNIYNIVHERAKAAAAAAAAAMALDVNLICFSRLG
jgi:hypothetical protein